VDGKKYGWMTLGEAVPEPKSDAGNEERVLSPLFVCHRKKSRNNCVDMAPRRKSPDSFDVEQAKVLFTWI